MARLKWQAGSTATITLIYGKPSVAEFRRFRSMQALAVRTATGPSGRAAAYTATRRVPGPGAARFASISEQIRAGKERLAGRYKAEKFIAYFQSFSNTYAPLPRLEALYGEALADPDIVGLSIGTRPDCVSDETLDYLALLAKPISSGWNTASSRQKMRP